MVTVEKRMSGNMMCPNHKATNRKYREQYDRIFRKPKDDKACPKKTK